MKKPLVIFCAFLAVVEGGCHTARTTSFEFVDPAHMETPVDASKLKIEKEKTVFVDAKPIGVLSKPRFPSGSFHTPSSPVTIVVRIAVSEEGRAQIEGRSLVDVTIPSQFTAACDEAIRMAVAQWKFEPAQLAMLEPQKDGRPLLVSQNPTDCTLEAAFTFSAAGVVESKVTQK